MMPHTMSDKLVWLLGLSLTAHWAVATPTQGIAKLQGCADKIKYAALGDSFASGPGAGNPLDSTACKRYDQAYGPLFAKANENQGHPVDFSFIACSGSKTTNVFEAPRGSSSGGGKDKDSQANLLKDKFLDVVMLMIGGNDVGFAELLDWCIYRFYDVYGIGCGFFDNDCSKDCQSVIDLISTEIDSIAFYDNIMQAIDAIFL